MYKRQLQVCQELGKTLKILYVSGEESKRQLKLRATRLGVNSDHLYILTETDVAVSYTHLDVYKRQSANLK